MPTPVHLLPRLLRRQLKSTATASDPASFVLPIRKLLVSYNEHLPQLRGLYDWIARDAVKLAEDFPSVEIVLQTHHRKTGTVKGFYLNSNRVKQIPVTDLSRLQVDKKVKLLLESSGDHLSNLARRPVVPGANPPVRGPWSGVHDSGQR